MKWSWGLAAIVATVIVAYMYLHSEDTGRGRRLEQLPDEFTLIHAGVDHEQKTIWALIRTANGPLLVHLPYNKVLAADLLQLDEIARVKNIEVPVRVKKPSASSVV